jgi:hypothetical protein
MEGKYEAKCERKLVVDKSEQPVKDPLMNGGGGTASGAGDKDSFA